MEERITNRDWTKAEIQDDKKSVSWGYRHIRLKKLWELENGLKDGTILKFPCPLNSKAYIRMGDHSIKEVTIVEYNIEPNGIFAKAIWL